MSATIHFGYSGQCYLTQEGLDDIHVVVPTFDILVCPIPFVKRVHIRVCIYLYAVSLTFSVQSYFGESFCALVSKWHVTQKADGRRAKRSEV